MTIKDYDARPETRVFRLDSECYIIYLGRNGNDYKPFLRIGNTPDLPQQVIENTLSIILTDRLTGNPAFETANISDMQLEEIRYLGDPDLVEKFKNFVRKANLHTEGFEEYHGDEEPMPNGSFVYFHTDGNMTVYYGRDKIFDLRERERRDGHFIELAKRIRSQYIKNQLRYRPEDLRNPGFIMLGGRAVLFESGQIIDPLLPADFFQGYTKAGVDPDQLAVVMDDALTESLSHVFKRKRSKQDSVVVVTTDVPLITSAADLFSVKKQEALSAKIMDFSDGSCELDNVALRRVDGWLLARFAGLEMDVLVPQRTTSAAPVGGQPDSGSLVLEPNGAFVSYRHARRADRLTVLPATPIAVTRGPLEPARLAGKYFASSGPFYTAVLPPDAAGIVELINAAMAAVVSGSDGGRLKQVESRLRDLDMNASPYLRPFLSSAESFLRMAKNGEAGLNVDRSVGAAAALIGRFLKDGGSGPAAEFLCGDLVVGERDIYVFYYPAKTNVTPNIIERSAVVNRKIDEELLESRDLYQSERERLLDLIAQLNIPQARRKSQSSKEKAADQGAVDSADGEAKKRETADDQRATERAIGDRTPVPRTDADRPAAAGPAGTSATAAISTPVGAPESGNRRSGWRRVGIAAIVVVLLAALAFALVKFFGARRNDVVASNDTYAPSGTTPGSADGEATGPGTSTEPGTAASGQAGTPAGAESQSEPDATNGPSGQSGGSAAPASGNGTSAGSNAQPGAATGANGTSPNPSAMSPNPSATSPAASTQSSVSIQSVVPSRELQDLADHLNIDGVQVTVLDLIRLTNYIATHNGFRAMGNADIRAGRNPNLIYPGDTFTLPDGQSYLARQHDAIWYIAADYLRASLTAKVNGYHALLAKYGDPPSTVDAKTELVNALRNLKNGSYSENFDTLIQSKVEELTQ